MMAGAGATDSTADIVGLMSCCAAAAASSSSSLVVVVVVLTSLSTAGAVAAGERMGENRMRKGRDSEWIRAGAFIPE